MDSEIISIFPTPIYKSKLGRELNKKELTFINDTKSKVYKNMSNTTSNDTYILNNKLFKNLKEELYLKIKDYFNKIISPEDNITPYITQSWLNYTEKDQYHHTHQHPNSLISGVLYINSDEKFDKIKFFNENYKIIKPEVKTWNAWNSESWWFSVKTGDIMLFPSSLTHALETKQGDKYKKSLSFNFFIKGIIDKKN